MNKILRVFTETDMRNSHDGLIRIAQKENVDLNKLNPGDHVVFVNGRLNKLKLYSWNGVLSYIRQGSGKLSLHIIEQIPMAFKAETGIDWKKAERLALLKKLGGVE